MLSKRSLEGYLIIDNRHAPSDPEATALRKTGSTREWLGAGPSPVLEMPTLTCSHCHRQIAVQPLRTRERSYCRKCDHYVCDDCALVAKLNGGKCLPLKQKLDIQQEQMFQALRG